MSGHTFYRIHLKDGAGQDPAFWRRVRNPYQVHKMVWRIFSDGSHKDRDFIYRLEMQEHTPVIYAVSTADRVDLDGIWRVDAKDYHPALRRGDRLGFNLRANPVRTKRDEEGRQHRHDVVMDAKYAMETRDNIEVDLVQQEGFAWLASRGERLGFSVEEGAVRVDGYRQHRFRKPRSGRRVTISTIDFTGALTVTDPDLFKEALYTGVGPAKSFGCGLLLVRRV
ncbi:CRISPR system Cascade subunit CasE [Methanofollis sp. W23]|uniref:type I-E CRISPR-associated protein Cas6/Cse3/CasE n=1 Tax=Methanofollis sp. W23 TaxID=2817849 RepID=UPI001AE64588|nr:type I-E CRISPR-associated protein Cas6/Cse3/CasE [Methanofollis sp. W23]MBP2146370.1 CRISPR system Cascade subunit CasE [Methanofollis sp. W23]